MTHWKEIDKLEAIIGDGNITPLISFLNKLQREGIVSDDDRQHWLSAICYTVKDQNRAWNALHDFAHEWFSVPDECKNGTCN